MRRPLPSCRPCRNLRERACNGASTAFTHLRARGSHPFPSLRAWTRGVARSAGWCGPLLHWKSDCATVRANLRPVIPAFHTPSGAAPRFPEKGGASTAYRSIGACLSPSIRAAASSRRRTRRAVVLRRRSFSACRRFASSCRLRRKRLKFRPVIDSGESRKASDMTRPRSHCSALAVASETAGVSV